MKGKGEYKKRVAKSTRKTVEDTLREMKKARVKADKKPKAEPRSTIFNQEIGGKGLPPVRPEKLNPGMTTPKGPLSFSMEHLLQPSGDHVLVVTAIGGFVKNKEEFIKTMAALDFNVVFLEYGMNCVRPPSIDRFDKGR